MKITNTERLKDQIVKGLTWTFLAEASIGSLARAEFEECERNKFKIRILESPISITLENASYYITVEKDALCFWKADAETKSYKYLTEFEFNALQNIYMIMMEIGVYVDRIITFEKGGVWTGKSA